MEHVAQHGGENVALAPPPEAPITVGFVCMSASVTMPVEAMKAQTLTSCESAEPAEFGRIELGAVAVAEQWLATIPGAKIPIAVPSFGATL